MLRESGFCNTLWWAAGSAAGHFAALPGGSKEKT
jgi:hypothetical protein